MPYYHVLLSLDTDSENQRCIFRDLNKRELVSSFVSKYKTGKDLLCGGEIIPLRSIRRLSVISTAQTMDEALAELDAKNEAHRHELNRGSGGLIFMGGVGNGPNDIAEAGQNVTSQFINDVPQPGLQQGFMTRVLGNPWIVGIGGTVIATGITAWLNWN